MPIQFILHFVQTNVLKINSTPSPSPASPAHARRPWPPGPLPASDFPSHCIAATLACRSALQICQARSRLGHARQYHFPDSGLLWPQSSAGSCMSQKSQFRHYLLRRTFLDQRIQSSHLNCKCPY